MKNKTVVLVGRPNVGKSTLFNRLTKTRSAITSNVSGTTRDRHYGFCSHNGVEICVIDTGGYNINTSESNILKEINNQIEMAIKEANTILFIVDCHDGLVGCDKIFANLLRKINKKVLLVANKSDNDTFRNYAYEFAELGFGEPFVICANNGKGVNVLLDEVTKNFIVSDNTISLLDQKQVLPKIAIIGKPNVGKSSLLNILVGKEQMIVDDKAGTTRDSVETKYNLYGQNFIIVDTAGIRKKSVKKDDIEFYSTLRSIDSLDRCDVCLYVIDAREGVSFQDMVLLNLAVKRKKGIVILFNKCDLIETQDEKIFKEFKKAVVNKLKMLKFIPVLYISVLENKNIQKVIQKAMEVYKNKNQKLQTSKLNDVLLPLISNKPPHTRQGHYVKIKYITQLPTDTIDIAFFCNSPSKVNIGYKRFLENNIRKNFQLEGVPLGIVFKNK